MKTKILLSIFCIFALSSYSQVFTEYFETAPVNANLEGYNGWYVSQHTSNNLGASPKIDELPLFFTAYPGSNVGRVAVLDSLVGITSATQRLSTRRVIFAGADTLKAPAVGAFYAAFIINIEPKSHREYRDFFTWEGSETSIFNRGRYFAKNSLDGTEVVFAVTKNSTTASHFINSSDNLQLTLQTGVNHLLVAKYEAIDGGSNDIVSLFVNPDPLKSETDNAARKLSSIDTATDYTAGTPIKINLRQRGVGAQIGGIRVSRTWGEAVMGVSSGLNAFTANKHNISANKKEIITGAMGSLKVYSVSGALLANVETTGKYNSNLAKGLYLVQFTDNAGVTSKAKVIID